jgi:hypothetical protein
MKNLVRIASRVGLAALSVSLAAFHPGNQVQAAGGPAETASATYHVLAPIESGNLLLFPVIRANSKGQGETPFITLDEGIRSGEVEVTEAGNVQGLVRPRGPSGTPPFPNGGFRVRPLRPDTGYRGDQVNTLVLVNHSKRPLLLLAGEIVTGGKQDRVIAKDRIVAPDADPIDLSVFCIEPGRWTGSSSMFGAAGKAPALGFMVQPEVREQAMVAKDQQQVWNSVHGAIAQMAVAAPPPSASQTVTVEGPQIFGTTSYAKAIQSSGVSEKVDDAAAPVMRDREQVLAKLREEHAVGVVAAVHGEIIWADLFADTDLLSRYWTKLVRSYAAESLTGGDAHAAPSLADAQRFLDASSGARETSEGDVGIYRYSELHGGDTETFVLDSLLPGTGYEVHISKMKLKGGAYRVEPLVLIH